MNFSRGSRRRAGQTPPSRPTLSSIKHSTAQLQRSPTAVRADRESETDPADVPRSLAARMSDWITAFWR